jgi:Mg2+-importing ATPase
LLFRSRPGRLLPVSTIVLVPVAFLIPYLPYAQALGFVPMPFSLLAALAGITGMYVLAAESMKTWFYRHVD